MKTNNSDSKCTQGILSTLDECAISYDFPMFNNVYFAYGKARLSAFIHERDWIIIIQEISYFRQAAEFGIYVSAYGNKLAKQGMQNEHNNNNAPAISFEENHAFNLLDKWHFTFHIKGSPHIFSPTESDYINAGVNSATDQDVPAQIIRLLVHIMPFNLYYDDEELLNICKVPVDYYKRTIQLDDWIHPNIAGDELPSGSPSFVELAHVLCKSDATLYQTDRPGNTAWQNWLID